MTADNTQIVILTTGLAAVTLIDTAGAVLSRVLQFRYTYLSALSFLVYIGIGFWGTKFLNPNSAITTAIVVGVYDATVGFRMSIRLKANIGITQEEVKKVSGIYSIVVMVILAVFFSTIGYALSGAGQTL